MGGETVQPSVGVGGQFNTEPLRSPEAGCLKCLGGTSSLDLPRPQESISLSMIRTACVLEYSI